MANESIRQLSDALGIATARLSGDPQRMQMALGMQQSRKLQEQENKLNDWIGENIPESQQRFLQALSYSDKVKVLTSISKYFRQSYKSR
jgi:outer membrane biogenesis lipoprotein LolB